MGSFCHRCSNISSLLSSIRSTTFRTAFCRSLQGLVCTRCFHFNHSFLQAMQIHSSGIFSPYLVFVQSWCPDTPHLAQMCFILLPHCSQHRNLNTCIHKFLCSSSPTPTITVSTVYAILVGFIFFYQKVVFVL